MTRAAGPATLDTNIAVYALTASDKTATATSAMYACKFLSAQVVNEYANVAFRKQRLDWTVIVKDLQVIRSAVPLVLPIDDAAHIDAVRIARRYQLSFYDALMLAVALSGGARIIYSEDMQHDMAIDGTLRIVDPFRPDA